MDSRMRDGCGTQWAIWAGCLMSPELMGKKVFVLSDNYGLLRVIEFSLKTKNLKVVRFPPSPQNRENGETNNPDLVIVALSSPASESIKTWVQSAANGHGDGVPLLIISSTPPELQGCDHIAHLSFPFDLDGLYNQVEEMLLKPA
ncbi:MAG: hypothetical protein ACOYZ7_12405 [Chloroflexota bacterium]